VRFPPLDPSKAVTYPLSRRKNKVAADTLGAVWRTGGNLRDFLACLPRTLAAADLLEVARRMAAAAKGQCPVILGMGAHPIKVGLSPLIIDLLERSIVSAIAMNGAGIIHDFELAQQGATSEDVASALSDGSFGMAQETGEFLNTAVRAGVKERNLGIGQAVGEKDSY